MSTIDKTSVRKELDNLKSRFNQLSTEGQVSNDLNGLMTSLFALLSLLIAIFLEKQTKKNNKNSSKPSSHTEKDDTSLSESGTHGQGQSIKHNAALNTRSVATIQMSMVSHCGTCGEDQMVARQD